MKYHNRPNDHFVQTVQYDNNQYCPKKFEPCDCGKDICINNNPIINICVNGNENGTILPFRSSYFEALGGGQSIQSNANISFDTNSADSAGSDITLNDSGTVFTILRTGLYHIEWNLNLTASTTSAVVGITENGAPASGSATVSGGNFASGTLIEVTSVPFNISLHNYSNAITIEDILPFNNTAASIRIVRFADSAT